MFALLTLLVAQAASLPQALGQDFDARQAEHLWNRAGFGASTALVEQSVALGRAGLVERLLAVESWVEEPFYARKRADGDLAKVLKSLPEAERDKRTAELREEDRAQIVDFLDWWVERMLASDEPLRERMVLFWHGHFTSSMEAVKSSYEMIQQNQLFRRHALGGFRELLHGVARDPAMLVYLDNASSKKVHPNENFARELLELFTLGEGNYSEQDIQEVARAFTGWGQKNGRFHFDPKRHDNGKKTVLGVTGRLDGDDVLEILLRQEACARHLAHALLVYFEGCEPAPARLARYAAELRGAGYRLDAFLRTLFLDPEFYSAEKLAGAMASPLDYLVGGARRLGAEPEARLLVVGAGLLGQRLFYPPSVRGWEGGESWATSSSLLLRGELAGMLLGRVRGRDLLSEVRAGMESAGEDEPSMAEGMDGGLEPAMEAGLEPPTTPRSATARRRLSPELRALARIENRPRLNLTQRLTRAGGASDAALARALVDELLAIPAPAALVAEVEARLARARVELDLADAPWSARPELAEPLLRELAHGLLALPEAQLH